MEITSDPAMQAGAFGLCVLVIGILAYTVKTLLGIISNHLSHIQTSIDSLPCKRGEGCPVEDD